MSIILRKNCFKRPKLNLKIPSMQKAHTSRSLSLSAIVLERNREVDREISRMRTVNRSICVNQWDQIGRLFYFSVHFFSTVAIIFGKMIPKLRCNLRNFWNDTTFCPFGHCDWNEEDFCLNNLATLVLTRNREREGKKYGALWLKELLLACPIEQKAKDKCTVLIHFSTGVAAAICD